MIRIHVSELAIDRLLAGEIDAADAAAMRDHAADCARCGGALDDALAVQREVAVARPRLTGIPVPFHRRRVVMATVATGALAAAFAIIIVSPHRDRAADGGEVRTKGASIVGFFVAHGDQVRRGAVRETVMPGDRVSFTTTTSAPVWFAAIGNDAAGTRSVYVAPRLVEPGRDRELSIAIELDGTLGNETVSGVFCDQPFDAGAVDPVVPPPGCTVDRFTLVKVPR